MSFLAPGYLLGGLLVAALVAALHLLAWRRPPETPFPTARFVPDRPARAASRALRPTDLPLLLLRVLLVMLVAVAFARPVRSSETGARRVILADRSRAVARPGEVADSVRRLARPGDVVIAFDSVARLLAADTGALEARAGAPTRAAGSLSAALVRAAQAAPALRRRADSLELVVVSPLVREEGDAATIAIRNQWRGRVTLVRVGAAVDAAPAAAVAVAGSAADPVVAALELQRLRRAGGLVRLVRGAPSTSDRRWAEGAGHVLVVWPDSGTLEGWTRRASIDRAGAVAAGDTVVVATFARRWTRGDTGAGVVARWVDGTPAADEVATGAGCTRRVAIPVPAAGDLALRPSFGALVRQLVAPCSGAADLRPAADSLRRALAGTGPLLATASLAAGDERSSLVPWLLGAAILLGLLELLARRARRKP